MTSFPTEIAQILLDRSAVKVSLDPPFQWTSGLLAPVYCDNRTLPSFPEDREKIVQAFIQMIQSKRWKPDAIGGTATAGISWAAFVAQRMNLPMFYVRPKPKAYGAGKQVEGLVEEGSKIVMIEDLFSTGGSSIRAAQAFQKEANGEVLGIFSIVTYGLKKAEEAFREAGFKHDSITTFSDILKLLQESGDFTKSEVKHISEFAQNPEQWSENMTFSKT